MNAFCDSAAASFRGEGKAEPFSFPWIYSLDIWESVFWNSPVLFLDRSVSKRSPFFGLFLEAISVAPASSAVALIEVQIAEALDLAEAPQLGALKVISFCP
jgi:hypothetical protein